MLCIIFSECFSFRQIDVREPGDVAAAMQFSNKTGIPLVVKNTGHDFQGRSSGPGTLALWMANIKNSTFHNEFVAEGCNTEATRAITNQVPALPRALMFTSY